MCSGSGASATASLAPGRARATAHQRLLYDALRQPVFTGRGPYGEWQAALTTASLCILADIPPCGIPSAFWRIFLTEGIYILGRYSSLWETLCIPFGYSSLRDYLHFRRIFLPGGGPRHSRRIILPLEDSPVSANIPSSGRKPTSQRLFIEVFFIPNRTFVDLHSPLSIFVRFALIASTGIRITNKITF